MFLMSEWLRGVFKSTGVFMAALAMSAMIAAPVGAEGILGQVNARQVQINGAASPSHATLLASSTIETASHAAIVHLASGQTLSLAPHSQARFDGSLSTGVEVSLRFGSIAYRDSTGEVVQIADASTFTLQQGGVQQGEAINGNGEGFPLCALKSGDIATCLADPDDSSCEWEYMESVAADDVEAFLGQGGTFLTAGDLDAYFSLPGKSSEGKELVVYDCRDRKAAAIVAAPAVAGGLSAAAIAGIAVGGALGVVIIDDASSDDPTPAPVGTQITP